jgi:hypothetical protein
VLGGGVGEFVARSPEPMASTGEGGSVVDAGGGGGGSTWTEEWKEASVVYYQSSRRRTPTRTRTLVIAPMFSKSSASICFAAPLHIIGYFL